MHLKLPPGIVALIAAFLMYLLAHFLPFGYFEFTGSFYLMLFLLGLGFLIGLFSLFQFFTSKTSIDPLHPNKASKLVVSGIYKFTRNPMYLALLLVLLALGLYFSNAFNVLIAAAFVSYMNKFQIIPEEKVLIGKFGKEYQNYLINVRRWF